MSWRVWNPTPLVGVRRVVLRRPCNANANEKVSKVNLEEAQLVGGYLDIAVTKTTLIGQPLETEYVGGQVVCSNHKFTPINRKIVVSRSTNRSKQSHYYLSLKLFLKALFFFPIDDILHRVVGLF